MIVVGGIFDIAALADKKRCRDDRLMVYGVAAFVQTL